MCKWQRGIGAIICLLMSFESLAAAIPQSSAETLRCDSFIPSPRLQHLFDRYVKIYMEGFPEGATFYGYPGFDELWTDLSEEGFALRLNQMAGLLDELKTIDKSILLEEDRLNYDIFENVLEDFLAAASFKGEYMPFNQIEGIHINIGLIFQAMSAASEKEYRTILSRLKKIPVLAEQNITLARKGMKEGIVPPRITQLNVPDQLLSLMTPQIVDSFLYTPFLNMPDSIPLPNQAALKQQAQQILEKEVYPALQRLRTFVTNEYIPHCRDTIAISDLPQGKEWYAYCIKSMTTTDLSADDIHQIGLDEMARIRKEMQLILDQLQFKGSLEQFFEFLQSDPCFYYSQREDLLQGYRDILQGIEKQLPLLFGTLPTTPYEVVPVPEYSEEQAPGAYYLMGSPQRPGRFYANTSHLSLRSKWAMEALALHEALPGHHMQISLALENTSIPFFRKLSSFTAYVEGWGLYSERLGLELGLYQDPYSNFGRLCGEMFRAIRLVVDTGIHAFGWTRQQAIDLFKARLGDGGHDIEAEVDRYIAWPGQALAYKIGERKICEMRKYAENKLGSKFNIRAFHDEVLSKGALPLFLFESRMKEWTAKQKMLD